MSNKTYVKNQDSKTKRLKVVRAGLRVAELNLAWWERRLKEVAGDHDQS